MARRAALLIAGWHRADPVLFWCLTALLAAVAIPIWAVRYLPFLDIPQHLSTIAVMHHLGDPAFGYDQFFTVETGSTPYLLYYVTCDLLAHVVGVDAANRLFITLYLVLLPIGVLYCFAAFGRLRAAALLAVPLAYNTFLFYGFVNYVFALPFLFFGLGLVKRALDAGDLRWSREAALALVGLVVYYSHLQVFLVYAGGVGLVVLLHWPGWRGAVRRVAHLLPVALLFVWWAIASKGLAGGEAWERAVSQRYASLQGASWEPLSDTLHNFAERVMQSYQDRSDEVIFILVAFGLGLVLLTRSARATTRPGDYALEALTLFVALFYVGLPTSYKWIWPVNWRFAPLLMLLGLAWGWDGVARWARHGLTAAFALIAAYAITVHVQHFRAFDAEARAFEPVLDAMAPSSRVMALIFDSGSPTVTGPVYLHFDQYYQVRKGGVAVYSFAEAPQSPVRFRPPEFGGPPPTPLRSEWKAGEFKFTRDHGRYYDYFLVRGGGAWLPSRAGFPRGEVTLVMESGPWSLYKHDRQ